MLRVSASCGFLLEPQVSLPIGFEVARRNARGLRPRYDFPMRRIDTRDRVQAQADFAAALARMRVEIATAGIDSEFITRHGAVVRVHISLSSDDTAEGASLTPEIYEAWHDLGASFDIDVIP